MCLLALGALLKSRSSHKKATSGPSMQPANPSGNSRRGRRYQSDVEKYGYEVAEQNYQRRAAAGAAGETMQMKTTFSHFRIYEEKLLLLEFGL
ncbi:hypothetical protein PVAR5_1293 [Paecilomyces variotii No. 5]|uniref:Uncharacterized protein n=1 Tax=Byssochlamys spectabilis (strain No. 5 / NBRC 109023) TaxID=1356009 RepID=V5HT75_BYSSN|nr:hypothetical protein PVAR5_1293 [Paecilomyces variotii No. 5]